MATARSNVYEFKITLKQIKPKVWRRIQVPENYSFYDLHIAIQDSMGWEDRHLHKFEMKNPRTGRTDLIGTPPPNGRSDWGCPIISEENTRIASYFVAAKDKVMYEYDFGESWMHEIVLEKIIPSKPNVKYPRCVSGRRVCPPEDGGGYKSDESEDSNPEEFDPKSVKFDDPRERVNLGCL